MDIAISKKYFAQFVNGDWKRGHLQLSMRRLYGSHVVLVLRAAIDIFETLETSEKERGETSVDRS
jgi:hypothetical protein